MLYLSSLRGALAIIKIIYYFLVHRPLNLGQHNPSIIQIPLYLGSIYISTDISLPLAILLRTPRTSLTPNFAWFFS